MKPDPQREAQMEKAREEIRELMRQGVLMCMPQMMVRDITDQSSTMPRNSAILFRNTQPKNDDSPAYGGVLRLDDGRKFWALVWPRTVRGKQVIELRLVKKPEE
jgi:hypothetical protein